MLVTHQLQYLKDVQLAVLMNMGRIEAQGTYNDLKQSRKHSLLWLGMEEDKDGMDENLAEEVRIGVLCTFIGSSNASFRFIKKMKLFIPILFD